MLKIEKVSRARERVKHAKIRRVIRKHAERVVKSKKNK